MADLSMYGEVRTLKMGVDQYDILAEVNKLLASGWDLIDAKVGQWGGTPVKSEEKTVGVSNAPGYCFILGKRRV